MSRKAGRQIQHLGTGVASQTRLELAPDLPFEEWKQLGVGLQRKASELAWQLGDWLAYGYKVYGASQVAEAAAELGMDTDRLRQYQWVADNIDPSRRRQNLSW